VAERRILIVDGIEAFATMLKEGLESSGPFEAIVATSAADALNALHRDQIDLAIVDMGLEDMDGPTLVKTLRQSRPNLRIVVIPLFGQELAEDELSLEVQGVLPKPFFIGDLPGLIRQALTCPFGEAPALDIPVEAPPKPRLEPPPVPKAVRREPVAAPRDVDGILEALFREIRAQAVLFTRGSELIAHAGNVTQERAQEMAVLTAESLSAAHKIAAFLGESNDRFEQCTFEGEGFSVYSVNVTPSTILSVALSARTPVGMVRLNLRRTTDALANVWYE